MLINEKKIYTPDNSALLEYKARIETGEILVGRELWQELTRLADDMSNERYFYDTADALKRMHFMEHCVRLTKSPFYNKPMILMLWQKAFIETIYSFKMTEESAEKGFSIDRFKKILLLIARKNTKSETCSGLAETELFIGNAGADIVCSSNDDNQASIVYDAIDTMRQLIDPRDLDTKRNQRFILNKISNSKIFKLSDRTRNKEGRNIDFAIIDETHEMTTNVIAKSIEQSQSLKDNPKFINITTEGFVVDGYLDEELRKARKIISGEDTGIAAERFLPWLYTQDSEAEIWQDPRTWVKSNPTLGAIKKWGYLEEQIDLAKNSKSDRIFVLSKDFNIKQNAAESWLNIEDYSYKAVYDLEDFRGCVCLGAVDLAETTDLTNAKILLMRKDDKTKYIYSHYFIPEGKLENADDAAAGAKYKEWAKAGLLTITDGNEVDLSIVADWFYSLFKDYKIKLFKCGYDQKFATDWISRMGEYGWTRESKDLIMILQNADTLSTAINLCEADFKHQLINYNENEVDAWCLKNALIELDRKGKALLVKKERIRRIDGAVTLVILYETFRRCRTEFMQMLK
ncbi:terminase large subunit [Ruminococcus sp. 210702-SL.1.03]|mgnify:FL=1|uniref:terminase large subunit n=1 Tax=Ruminococcus sp. 210702-SL.1.03 TaxID=2883233 RepID=UPI001D06D46F|nr:terminase TerL endonuclease subunit [Ruminococcus sp. 210702-SL.1.03]MCB6616059.1 terminase large subunit [Ruminococcus sp. 210702-SL.1.03]